MMEVKNVTSLWELHDDGIFAPVRVVVFREFRSQAAGLDSNHRIQLRIKVRRAPKNLSCDLEFLDWYAGVIEGMLCQISEQFTEGLGTMQNMAADETLNLPEVLFVFGHRIPLKQRFNGSVTSRA